MEKLNIFSVIIKITRFTLFILCLWGYDAQGQERGRVRQAPPINQGPVRTPETPKKEANEADDFEILNPNVRYRNQFEPVKPVNPVVNEDPDTMFPIDLTIVEITDSMQVGDDKVKVAEYFEIWDEKNINPYNIDPLEFDDSIILELYNEEEGRYAAMPLKEIRPTSQFGLRWGRNHTGTDLNLNTGDTIVSVFDGMVRVVGSDGRGYGRFVVVRHYNGLETLYGHMSKPLSKSGMVVKAGDVIGLGGSTGRSTGPHLHFEVRYEGNPFDPRHIFDWSVPKVRSREFELTKSVWDYRRGGRSYKSEFEAGDQAAAYSSVVWHKIRKGDTLTSIARKYGTTVNKIARMNNLSVRSVLRVGNRLRVR